MKPSIWGVPDGRALTAVLIGLCLEKRVCENDTIDFHYLFFLKFVTTSDKLCLWEATLRKRSLRRWPL